MLRITIHHEVEEIRLELEGELSLRDERLGTLQGELSAAVSGLTATAITVATPVHAARPLPCAKAPVRAAIFATLMATDANANRPISCWRPP